MSEESLNIRAREIQDWLAPRLAEALNLPPERIDAHAPLANYGLGSVEALVLVGDLEDWSGHSLEPTLLWDYPTLAAVAAFLARLEAGMPAPAVGESQP